MYGPAYFSHWTAARAHTHTHHRSTVDGAQSAWTISRSGEAQRSSDRARASCVYSNTRTKRKRSATKVPCIYPPSRRPSRPGGSHAPLNCRESRQRRPTGSLGRPCMSVLTTPGALQPAKTSLNPVNAQVLARPPPLDINPRVAVFLKQTTESTSPPLSVKSAGDYDRLHWRR